MTAGVSLMAPFRACHRKEARFKSIERALKFPD
jgi:hypothetical protein